MNTPMGRPKDDDVPMRDGSEEVLAKSGTNGHGAGNGTEAALIIRSHCRRRWTNGR